jgi:autotransporter-associated beta strand protein
MTKHDKSLTGRILKAAAGLCLTCAPAFAQTTYDWAGTTAGSWETATNWTPNAAGSAFTNLDTAQLTKDFTTATWTLDAPVTINKLIYEDTGATGDIAGALNAGIGGTLTFGGTAPSVDARNGITINANIFGTAGLTKVAGGNALTLSGDNAGLSGTLTVGASIGASSNSSGVVITSLAALGGITNVTTTGGATTGGYFRIGGVDVTLPSTVTFNLSGQGGNSAPPGTLIAGGSGVKRIEGTINLVTAGVRLANDTATRLDLAGQITGNQGVIFRRALNEGIHLLNTSNNWTGATTHSGGLLWFETGTLPSNHLVHAASDPGSIQTSGSFTRPLAASGAGAMLSQYVQNGNRETGFSARGGPLTVNFGGAGADVKFFNFAQQNGTWLISSNTITMTSTAGYAVGMVVSGGTGLPANATITAVTPTTLTINNPTTAAQATAVAVPGSTNNAGQWNTNILNLNWNHSNSKLTFENGLDLNGFNRTFAIRSSVAEISGVIKNTHATITNSGIKIVGDASIGDGTASTVYGTLILSGANTFTGGVNVARGRLQITNSQSLGLQNGTTNKTITLNNGAAGNSQLALDGSGGDIDLPSWMIYNTSNNTRAAILNVAGNNTVRGNITMTTGGGGTTLQADAGKLTLTGNITPNTTARDLRIGGAGNLELTGIIADGGTTNMPVTKLGAGTVTLSGPSTYTGATNLEGGLTLVNGTLANTPTTVKSTATLGGSGTIGGNVTLETGGTISPGNSPGILTIGSLISTGTGTLSIELNGTTPGTEYDQLAISSLGGGTGGISLGSTVITLSLGFTPAINDKFFIVLNDGSDPIVGNLFNGITPLIEGDTVNLAGQNFTISYVDNGDAGTVGNDISLTAIPESSSTILGAIGLSSLLWRKR